MFDRSVPSGVNMGQQLTSESAMVPCLSKVDSTQGFESGHARHEQVAPTIPAIVEMAIIAEITCFQIWTGRRDVRRFRW